jgi:hypothetical protein
MALTSRVSSESAWVRLGLCYSFTPRDTEACYGQLVTQMYYYHVSSESPLVWCGLASVMLDANRHRSVLWLVGHMLMQVKPGVCYQSE